MVFDPFYDKTDAEIRREALTNAKKAKIKQAVGGKCEMPGCRAKAYEIHHIVPVSKDGRNIGSNLIALCANHHRDAHDGKITQTRLKEIVKKRSKKVKQEITNILKDRKRVKATGGFSGGNLKVDLPKIELPTFSDPFGASSSTRRKRSSSTKKSTTKSKTKSKAKRTTSKKTKKKTSSTKKRTSSRRKRDDFWSIF